MHRLFANLARAVSKVFLAVFWSLYVKTRFVVCGNVMSIAISLAETLASLGLLFFSGSLMIMVWRSVSMSVHFKRMASPLRAAVSFSVCSRVDSWCLVPLMNWSSSFSVGMKMILSFRLKVGSSSGSYWIL